jgi:transposase-like protein
VPKPYPREFREDVVRVARNREPGVQVKDIAKDFGISESCLTNGLAAADVEDGVKPGTTAAENAELRRRSAGSGCSSGRRRSCAEPPPISPRRSCRGNELPARP